MTKLSNLIETPFFPRGALFGPVRSVRLILLCAASFFNGLAGGRINFEGAG